MDKGLNFLQQCHAEAAKAVAAGKCIACGQPFSDANTHSAAGWKERELHT